MLEPVLPRHMNPMKKGKPTGEVCKLCGQPFLSGQLHAGVFKSDAPPLNDEDVRVSDEGYVEGHYACVVAALGADETLKAMHAGKLPNIDPAVLINGCLPTDLGGL